MHRRRQLRSTQAAAILACGLPRWDAGWPTARGARRFGALENQPARTSRRQGQTATSSRILQSGDSERRLKAPKPANVTGRGTAAWTAYAAYAAHRPDERRWPLAPRMQNPTICVRSWQRFTRRPSAPSRRSVSCGSGLGHLGDPSNTNADVRELFAFCGQPGLTGHIWRRIVATIMSRAG